MARLNSTRDAWSAVQDPETDEYISLDDDVEQDVAERLVEEYDQLSIADENSAEAEDDGEDGDADEDELDELLAGTVEDVQDALETGDYDDRLDDIESRADRQGVEDAVDDRRGDVEG